MNELKTFTMAELAEQIKTTKANLFDVLVAEEDLNNQLKNLLVRKKSMLTHLEELKKELQK